MLGWGEPMATIAASIPKSSSAEIPPLEAGDLLDRITFHERYEAMPPGVRAELIGGIVYMPSPLKNPHGAIHGAVMGWLRVYKAGTPGVRAFDNTTDKLGEDSEPQPDAMLVLQGGQTHEDEEGFTVGPPEFVAEVASSSVSMDLHAKKHDYERFGVREYLVIIAREQRLIWWVRDGSRFIELAASPDGIWRSPNIAGLWLDAAALFRDDDRRLHEVVAQGLQTPEHAAFVAARTKP